ncbi:MAG: DUF1194 domain-containing protein [Hyphomicrobiaceae bacterium]
MAAGNAAGEPVDLELVLAVDASGSVDPSEYELQLRGIADAFRDPAVKQAIRSGPLARIAVALVVWADATTPKDDSPWHVISTPETADAFADLVETYPRRVEGGTGIGSALAYAIRMIEFNAIAGTRRVVDVSGDGVETPVREYAVLLPQARYMARALGVTINGLAIANEVHDLDRYYDANVRAGPGSFVMRAADFEAFRDAIRAKLLREIEAQVAERPPVSPFGRKEPWPGRAGDVAHPTLAEAVAR